MSTQWAKAGGSGAGFGTSQKWGAIAVVLAFLSFPFVVIAPHLRDVSLREIIDDFFPSSERVEFVTELHGTFPEGFSVPGNGQYVSLTHWSAHEVLPQLGYPGVDTNHWDYIIVRGPVDTARSNFDYLRIPKGHSLQEKSTEKLCLYRYASCYYTQTVQGTVLDLRAD